MSNDPIMDATETEKEVMEATYKLPEAPASVTVKLWIDDYNVMLTMRSQKVSDVVEQLEYIINTAKKKGWKSTWDKGEAPATGGKKAYSKPPADPNAPTCPTHNRQMRKFDGRYGEFWKCTAKIGDGWCNEKVNIKE